MLGVAHTECCTNVLYNLHIVLHVAGKGIYIVVYVAARCCKEVITPVCTDNRRCLVIEMEHALQLCLIVFLELIAHEVTNVVSLRCYLIEISVVVVVVYEVEEQRVFAQLIFSSSLPTPSFATHVVVGTSGNIFTRVRTIGKLIAV